MCRPYTIKEYRRIKPQNYVELGKLQPGKEAV
jgi:hypothetical protein